MPNGHATRTIYVGIKPQSTVSAVKVGLRRTRTDMQATRTAPGRESRIDRSNLNARGGGFVFDKATELGERPSVQMFGHVSLGVPADAGQVFQDNSLLVGLSVRDDFLANAVARVCNKSILTSRDTPQHTLCCAAAVGLESRSCVLKPSLLVTNKLRRVKSAIRRNSNALHAQINPKTAGRRLRFWRFSANRDVQVELSLSENQVCGANLPCTQLGTHRAGHLQLPRYPTFRADRQARFVKIAFESQRARVEAHRRSSLELMLLFTVAGIRLRDFSNRVDRVLRWQAGVLAHLPIGSMVDVVTAMQFPLTCYFGDQIARFGELAHCCSQFVTDVWRNNQLRLEGLLSFLHADYFTTVKGV